MHRGKVPEGANLSSNWGAYEELLSVLLPVDITIGLTRFR
jgi:hypothetical protein